MWTFGLKRSWPSFRDALAPNVSSGQLAAFALPMVLMVHPGEWSGVSG